MSERTVSGQLIPANCSFAQRRQSPFANRDRRQIEVEQSLREHGQAPLLVHLNKLRQEHDSFDVRYHNAELELRIERTINKINNSQLGRSDKITSLRALGVLTE